MLEASPWAPTHLSLSAPPGNRSRESAVLLAASSNAALLLAAAS